MSNLTYSGCRFTLFFKEHHPPLWSSFWANEYFLRAYRQLTKTDVGFLYFIDSNELTGYMQSDGPEILFQRLRRVMTPAWTRRQHALFNQRRQRLDRLLARSQQSRLDSKTQQAILLTVYRMASSIYPISNAGYLFSQELERSIRQRLAGTHSPQAINVIMAQAGTPIHPTTLQQYRRDVEVLAQRLKRDHLTTLPKLRQALVARPALKRRLITLHRRYKFLTPIGAHERSKTTILNDVIEVQRSRPRRQTSIIVPKNVRTDVLLLRNLAYFKDEISSAIIPLVKFGFLPLWKQAARRLGLTLDELEQLPAEAVFGRHRSATTARRQVAQRRRGILFVHLPKRPVTIITGRRAILLHRRLVAKAKRLTFPVMSFQGQVGSSGKVRGIVQVIRTSSEIPKFASGRILVSVYTAPEFVPAMKRAVAVITDVGGVTSHAAIVSRELRKPCIVNTVIATQALATGDKVEVDADRGIVTILQKK